MSDFSDRPFVAGSVVGLRAFRVDSLGRLTGVSHRDVWTPGENVAVCHKDESSQASTLFGIPMTQLIQRDLARYYGITYTVPTITTKPVAEQVVNAAKEQHTTSGVQCSCGFYAYFDGRNDYLRPDYDDKTPKVAAIVEGWGVCTVGTRGFRAEKAKVIALIVPKNVPHDLARVLPRLLHNYPDVAIFAKKSTALAEFPLTDPLAEFTPETDDDFWTRSAS